MLVAGFMRGFVGFGGALVVIPVLSLIIGPLAAVPVAAISGLPSTVQLLPAAIRDSERAFVLPIAIATFSAAPFGAWVLVTTDPALMKVLIAACVLAMVVMIARGWELGTSTAITAAAGAGAGFIQGATGVGGPPIVTVALARKGDAHRQRGNVLGAVTAIALSSMIPMLYHGLFTLEVLIAGVVLTPVYSFGTWLGARYFLGNGQRHFRTAALLTVATIGTVTLFLAAREYSF